MTFEELNELACCTCHMSWSEVGKPVGLNGRWYCQGCFDIECDRIQKQNELRKQTECLCRQIEELKPRESEPEFSTIVDPDGFDIDDPESPINALASANARIEFLRRALDQAIEGYVANASVHPSHLPNVHPELAEYLKEVKGEC